jgi:predicted NACHT family NTPase
MSQSTPSTQRIPDVTRANGTYSLPSRIVNNPNKAQGIQNQRASEPADAALANDATQKVRAKSEEQPSMFRNERRWEEAEELDMQATERRERLLAQEHPDALRTAEGLAAVYRTQRRHDKRELPDGKLVASASHDNTVRPWDSATGTACQTLEGHSDVVMAVAFSPDGKLVASASKDKTVRLWDSATGTARKTLEGHADPVLAVAFSPDGKLVASASFDKTVRLWDSATGRAHKTLKGHSDWVRAMAFSPDGKLVASASYDKTVRLWGLRWGRR